MRNAIRYIRPIALTVLLLCGCRHEPMPEGPSTPTTAARETPDSLTENISAASVAVVPSTAVQAEDIVGRQRVSQGAPARIEADNVVLFIDSGSVANDVEISIVSTTVEHSGGIPSHMENVTADGAVYRMLPDGQKFDRDITIAMRYDSTSLPRGYTADDIYTFFYNEHTRMWQQVERDSVDTRNQVVYSRTNHFTDYINGVLKVPENSDAMAYTPTSIKDLQAADPLEGVALIAPPEANSMGTATLSYPLNLPAGRRGIQPQLSVSYNSAGGNGILGLGWDLPIGEISVDTRRGVPLYNDTLETETYMLDGEILVTADTDGDGRMHLNKPAYSSKWKPRIAGVGNTRFYPRVEGSFRRILRRGSGPQDYYWEVTDKNGTRYYYGETAEARLTDYSGNIARWCLQRVEDPYGNEMTYLYMPHSYYAPNSPFESRQILLRGIRYTSHPPTGTPGQYYVEFVYAPRNKIDATVSARYGFLEANAALLDHINVFYKDTVIRHYVFGYKLGAYEKTLLCNIIEATPEVYSADCSDCGGDTASGYSDYRTPEYVFCGDSTLSGDWQKYYQTNIFRYPNYRISDTDDYYSDHRLHGRIVATPVFSRDVYDRCTDMDSTCVRMAYTEHRFQYSGVPAEMLSPTTYLTNEGSEQENVKGPLFLLKGSPGSVGGSGTKSWNIGGAVDAGFGWNTFLKSITLGGSYTFSKSNSEGLLTLIDLDGDGLSDKIYKRGNTIFYRLRDNDNPGGFGAETEAHGISDFLRTTGRGNTWGLEGSVGFDGAGVCFGVNWTDGNSATTTYFSDIDGDGLPDIVRDGTVYYNRIYEDPYEVFTPLDSGVKFITVPSCGHTDTIYVGEPVDEWVFEGYTDSTIVTYDTLFEPETGVVLGVDTLYYTYTPPRPYEPDLENVRFWQAPWAGYIHLTDSARMLPATVAAGDGVRLLVQFHGGILAADTLRPGDSASFLDTVVQVNAGDRVYFRVRSMDTRTADRLMWNPTVTYCDMVGNHMSLPNSLGIDEASFSYERDFLLSGLQKVKMPFDAEVEVSVTAFDSVGRIPGNSTVCRCQVLVNGADSLHFFVTRNRTEYRKTLFLNKGDSVQVRIVADTVIDWSSIQTDCRMYVTANLAQDDDSMYACIDTLSYEDSTVYFFDYHPQIQKLVYSGNADPDSVYMYDGYTAAGYARFGTMYRNWGQFAYKNPKEWSDLIYENELETGDLAGILGQSQSSYEGLGEGAEVGVDSGDPESEATIGGMPAYNPLASSFFVMQPDFKRGCWTAYSDYAYIERGMLSNLPHPADGMTVAQIDSADYESSVPVSFPGATAVSKKSFNRSFGVSGSVSVDLGFSRSGGLSFTSSETRQLSDMLDLNGDGLPDVLSETRAQYTQPFGGLSRIKGVIDVDFLPAGYSLDTIVGGSYGGSALRMQWLPANSTRRAYKGLTGNVGSNLGGSHGSGSCATTWADLNGDGLPDKVYSTGGKIYYYMNTGYGFLPARTLFSDGTAHSFYSAGFSGGASCGAGMDFAWLNKEGAQIDQLAESLPSSLDTLKNILRRLLEKQKYNNSLNVSITAGLGVSSSINNTTDDLVDLNGDGLPDRVEASTNGYVIHFNTGSGFDNGTAVLHMLREADNISYTTDLTGAFTVGVTFGFIPLKIEGNPKGGLSRSLSRTLAQWSDMNGDGIPDYVWDAGDGYIGVRYSNLGTANRLTSVTLPTGGRYRLDYALNHDGVESNMRHYVMSSLKVTDGRMQAPPRRFRYRYHYRYYDRIQRDDYGYAEVVTIEDTSLSGTVDGRLTVRRYHNRDYMFRGLCHDIKVVDGLSGDTLSGEQYDYRLMELATGDLIDSIAPGCHGGGYPAVWKSKTILYDQGQPAITTCQRFEYTRFGNVEVVHDQGALNDSTDDYTATTFYDSVGDYIVSAVVEEHVVGVGVERNRTALRDNNTGDILTMTLYNNDGDDAVYDFHYDDYGNTDLVTFPENHQGQRFTIAYIYDSVTHSLPVSTTNAYGLTSHAAYDYRWQKPVKTTAVSGARIEYRYDSHGRLAELYAPLEYGGNHATIRHEYYDRFPQTNAYWSRCNLWARTLNMNNYDYIGAVAISDGLGRPRMVKREAAVDGIPVRIVSGWKELDGFGRPVREYRPSVEDITEADSIAHFPLQDTLYTRYTYDGLDRITRTDYPDSTYTKMSYMVGNDGNNVLRQKTLITDQNSHTTQIFTDVRNQRTTVIDPLNNSVIYRYDPFGQLTQTIDPENNATTHIYDALGRRTQRNHPSAGTTMWEYDAAGNMLRQTTNGGEEIEYIYDYLRPTHVEYSVRPWNNVWYEYGITGNEAGRIARQQDATGVQEFRYDHLGNVIYNRHTFVQPQTPLTFTLRTQWEYDSWGRVHKILYPDGENVEYTYDFGGALKSVTGYKPDIGSENYYIKQILYDQFGQRTYQKNGNDVETYYQYDDRSRRLSRMYNYQPVSGDTLQDNRYQYDAVGNIVEIVDSGLNTRIQNYEYDAADRLTHSDGWCHMNGLDAQPWYINDFEYSPAGHMTHKIAVGENLGTAQGQYQVNYDNSFLYDLPNPHAMSGIVDNLTGNEYEFEWDANGNLTRAHATPLEVTRGLCWTEDNRLQAYLESSDNGEIAAYYSYGADGERCFKLTSPRLTIQQNASSFGIPTLMYPTLYASPLITVTRTGYTKHYFEGSNRICSTIGGGFSTMDLDSVEYHVPCLADTYEEMRTWQQEGLEHAFGNCIGAEVETPDAPFLLYDVILSEMERHDGEPVFYYHSDHLGSAAYLTDDHGYVTQSLNYMPYGEDWVEDNRFNPIDTVRLGIYRFNGKEKDYESGFHYYGARYHWSEVLTGWLSVDPLADKYPNISPYNYCMWNPVKLVDLDGRDGVPVINKKNRTITVEVNIIFYMKNVGHIGRNQINSWMKNIMSDIDNEWNSRNWTYEYQGELYKVNFQFSYKFDNNIHDESDFHFDRINNKNNYIELSPQSTHQYDAKTGMRICGHRSHVSNHNRGKWYYNSKAAAHEVGHLLTLPDRYHPDPNSRSGYSPDKDWEGDVMAEPGGKGHVTQKSVNAVLDNLLNVN